MQLLAYAFQVHLSSTMIERILWSFPNGSNLLHRHVNKHVTTINKQWKSSHVIYYRRWWFFVLVFIFWLLKCYHNCQNVTQFPKCPKCIKNTTLACHNSVSATLSIHLNAIKLYQSYKMCSILGISQVMRHFGNHDIVKWHDHFSLLLLLLLLKTPDLLEFFSSSSY